MKKIYSRLLMTACLLASLTFSACEDKLDDDIQVVGSPSQGAYFPSTSPSDYDVEPSDTQITVYLERTNKDEAKTVNLITTDDSGFFTVPATASFGAGEETTSIDITFDASKFEPKDYKLIIAVDKADAFLYGMNSYEFTVGLGDDYRWLNIGTCQYNDAYFFDNFYECELQQHALNKKSYRLKSPYLEGFLAEGYSPDQYDASEVSEWISFELLSPGQTVYGVKVTSDNLVAYPDFGTGFFNSQYQDFIYCIFPGRVKNDESLWTFNCVKSYQEDGTPNVVQFAPYYYMFSVGGFNYSQTSDMIRIIFPGGRLMDAGADVEITSVETVDENVVVKANVTIGADATSARVALVEGNDAATANFLITKDRVEYITITESGEVTLTMPADSPEGIYSVVASTYMDKKPVEYNYDTFKYTLPDGDAWTLVGTGTYTYSQFFEGDDAGLSLYRSNEDPTQYKITDWGMGVDFLFTMDSRDAITVAPQWIGYTDGNYGDVYVTDMVEYTESVADGISYYTDGVFNFNVVYYVPAGVFGYGYETFTLDSDEGGAEAKAPARHTTPTINHKWYSVNSRQLKWNMPINKMIRIN